jgi:hypothetical protein
MRRILPLVLSAGLALAPASAQIALPWPGPGMPAAGGGGGSASYAAVFGDAQNINFASGSYTSPSQTWPAGTAVCGIYDGLANTNLVVTIKGTGATQIGTYSGTGHNGSLWRAAVTSGTGTVTVTTTGSFGDIGVSCGVVTTSTPTPTGSQLADMAGAGEPQATVTVTVPASGVAVVFAGAPTFGADPRPCSWTGATRQASNEAFVAGGNGAGMCGASTTTAGSTTPGVSTTGATFGFQGTSGSMEIAAWGP